MVLIIGGKHDLAARAQQIKKAIHKANNPQVRGGDLQRMKRKQLASYYSQYETVPVINGSKIIAYVKGAYLARIVLRTACTRYVMYMATIIRRHSLNSRAANPLPIFHKQLMVMENNLMRGDQTT